MYDPSVACRDSSSWLDQPQVKKHVLGILALENVSYLCNSRQSAWVMKELSASAPDMQLASYNYEAMQHNVEFGLHMRQSLRMYNTVDCAALD